MAVAGEHHPALEEYCNCIFELREDGVDVFQARVAERLNASRPAVNEMMRHVEAEGLIETDPSIALTAKGEAFAQRVVRIPEELEFEDGTLEFLEKFGFTPGRRGSVQSTNRDGGLVIDLDDTTVEVNAFISKRILVTA